MTWEEARAEIVNVLTPLKAAQNLIHNPTFEVDVGGAVSATLTPTQDTTMGKFGTSSLKLTATVTSTEKIEFFEYDGTTKIGVSPSVTYTFSFYGRMSGSGSAVGHTGIRWYDSGGVLIAHDFTLANAVFVAGNDWTRPSYSKVAPVNAAFAVPNWEETSSFSVGKILNIDGVQFERASAATIYVDGTQNGCTWDGTAHQSPSTRPYGTANVHAVPPNGFRPDQLPAFVIWPPALEVQRISGGYRKKIYTTRITAIVSDAELIRAHQAVDDMREMMVDAFDDATALNDTCTTIAGPRFEEATTIAYGEQRFTAFDAFLTVYLDHSTTWGR